LGLICLDLHTMLLMDCNVSRASAAALVDLSKLLLNLENLQG
jgi:hypothetical protein